MKIRFNLILSLLFFSSMSYAQTSDLETDDDGNAYYSDVMTATGLSSAQLHERAEQWIREYYKNPTGVMKVNEAGKIEGKARFKLNSYDKKGNVVPTGGFVSYQIHLLFKEGRYKYELKRIRWEHSSYYDVSKWMDPKQPNYNAENYNFYLQQTTDYLNKTIDSMIEYMENGPEVKSDEW